MTPDTDPSNLSGSYALNALDASEATDFEAHLRSSDATRYEVTELRDTAVLLGLAVDPVAPPAALKASIMDAIADLPQLPPLPQAVASAPAGSDTAPTPATRRAASRWFARPTTALAAAAAVLALVVGAGLVSTTVGRVTQQQVQADALAAINGAADVQRASVRLDGGGNATLVWSGQLASSALIVSGLDPLPRDRVYELWYIGADGPRAAGTFSMESAETWRVLDGRMRSGDVVGVTVEPVGGSAAPTTDPVVVIESS